MSAETKSLALPPLVMGGAGFSYQLTADPKSLPVLETVKKAFELGLTAIDTSPYYEPSEELLGTALSHPDIVSRYRRSDFSIMTKCGRVTEKEFDYSPAWIRKSVSRSLQRFNTPYLDVVFCHDVEFVTLEEAVKAVGVLFSLAKTGVVKNVGISGYDIGVLVNIATAVRARYGRSVDVVQNWAQLTLQNTRLEREGLRAFRSIGVKAVCNASPLAVGLLRSGGVPIGALGDWHPAPKGLRVAAQDAALWVQQQGDNLASLSLRFAISRAMQSSQPGFTVTTITGVGSMSDLYDNVQTAKRILMTPPRTGTKFLSEFDSSLKEFTTLNHDALALDLPLYQGVRNVLGPWVDYDFSDKTESPKGNVEAEKEILQVTKSESVVTSRL